MDNSESICSTCGKLVRKGLSGSMTQWIFSSDYCSCQKVKLSNNAAETEICSICGLEKKTSQQGSMTQWIFSRKTCSCSASDLGIDTRADSNFNPLNFSSSEVRENREQEPELLVSRDSFPVERYKAIKVLGEGANGTVYLSRDRLLGKIVTVKIIRLLSDTQVISFQKEAKALGKLTHPNIIKVFDFGPTPEGTPYLVLEYFDGSSLEQYLKDKGKISIAEAKEIFTRIADALDFAHQAGIYHRDLKPANILIGMGPEKLVKLIDFGIAHIMTGEVSQIETQGTTIAGTPSYMAAEILSGKPYDARMEIYSFGCMLFRALVGRVPFNAETALETLSLSANSSRSELLSDTNFDESEEITQILLKCLAIDPDDRYQSIAEVRESLESLLVENIEQTAFHIEENVNRPVEMPKKRLAIVSSLLIFLVIVPVTYSIVIPNIFQSKNTDKKLEQKRSSKKISKSNANKTSSQLEIEGIDFGALSLQELLNDKRSIKEIRASAEKGNSKDQFLLGIAYTNGKKGLPEDAEKAFNWMQKSALNGSIKAKTVLGAMYALGMGVKVDLSKSVKLFEEASLKNDKNAIHVLGNFYFMGLGVNKDYRKAMSLFMRAARLGQPLSFHQIGVMYHYGLGTPVNYKLALDWYRKGEARGNPTSTHQIGIMYQEGAGVKKDFKKALVCFKRAAALGVPEASNQIGLMYQNGMGVEKNPQEAMKWFKNAATEGLLASINNIGVLYDKGIGVKQDYAEALKWYRLGCDKGYAHSENNLGFMYEYGHGVKQDYKKAIALYRKAAAKGLPQGQNQLANMYLRGIGVKKDYSKARQLFLKAASSNLGTAQCTLGRIYHLGLGVEKNSVKAIEYYRLSAKQGYAPAAEIMAKMYETGDGVKQNKAKARQWKSVVLGTGSNQSSSNLP